MFGCNEPKLIFRVIVMKRLLFVFNPHSGTGETGKYLAEIVDIFTKEGYEVVVYPTQAPRDGTRKILADGENFDRIVVAGGDGMLHELVNAVLRLEKAVAIGYIPMGTVNDFARTHRISRNPLEAAKTAVSDTVECLDVGLFGEEYFSYVAAFGFASNVAYDTDQKAKNTWGVLAYVANAVKNIEPQHFNQVCCKMRVDTGTDILEDEFVFGAISNTLSIGGMPNLVEKAAVLDDGLLEGLFIKKPRTVSEMEQITRGLLTRNFDSPCLMFARAERFEIDSQKAAWTLDGESGGEHEHIVIQAKKQVLRIALPPKNGIQDEKSAE